MVLFLVRPISRRAVNSPIETIVASFVLATLAYFHLLSAIKHSAFLAPAPVGPARPSFAAKTTESWAAASKSAWTIPAADVTRVEVQQVVIQGPLSNATRWLASDSKSPLASALQAGCVRDDSGQCLIIHDTNNGDSVLVFQPGTRDAFHSVFRQRGKVQDGPSVLTLESAQPVALAEMGSGKWVAYAAQALVLRFWDLIKVGLVRSSPRSTC